jgi:hypothetical protein
LQSISLERNDVAKVLPLPHSHHAARRGGWLDPQKLNGFLRLRENIAAMRWRPSIDDIDEAESPAALT